MKRIAVFAHYDKDGKLSDNTLRLIEGLETVCEKIIMVSTNLKREELSLLPKKVDCYIRENIGYDFYSYKYGIEKIGNIYTYDELVLLNDSFFVSERFNLVEILDQVDKSHYEICGLIDSYQFNYHVQTFFIVLKKQSLLSVWFKNFWENVTILDTKIDIIFNYEIGLTQSAISHSLMVGSCFQWKPRSYFSAVLDCIKQKRLNMLLLSVFSYKYLREGNASHILWKEIYNEFGFCKWEVIRMYPEVIKYIDKTGSEAEVIEINDYLNTKASFYKEKKIDDNLIIDNVNVISAFSLENLQAKVRGKSRIAVVVHLFYLELLEEIVNYLKNIPVKFDLYISVVSISSGIQVEKKLRHFTNANVYIYCVKNQGRDVAPFVSLLNTGILDEYTCICKIHSKKSLYSTQGTSWRQEIYNELLGSTGRVLSIIDAFEKKSNIGLIGPEYSYLTNSEFWGANEAKVRELSAEIGIDEDEIKLGFFAGTMFWVNPRVLNNLKQLDLSVNDFEEENGLQDGSLAHAIERVFVPFSRHNNLKVTTVEFLESDVAERDYNKRRVPVLA